MFSSIHESAVPPRPVQFTDIGWHWSMFAKKKLIVHITIIVIIDQTKAKKTAPRNILAEYVNDLLLSDIY